MSPVDWAVSYVLPLVYLVGAEEGMMADIATIFRNNAIAQISLFVCVVQIPLLLTGKMIYVDIGWPCGLVVLGLNALCYGTGYWLRTYLVAGCFLLHGGRMALGAVFLFGSRSNFTFRFAQDLPRYEYAKVKWIASGMPSHTWWIKAQQDTLQQCFANMVILGAPLFLAATNPTPHLELLECVGIGIWLLAWAWENTADLQKQAFLTQCKRDSKAQPDQKESIKLAVLGMKPYDGYKLWTLCRHPNYFGEWMCWLGFVVTALPSLQALAGAGAATWQVLGMGLMLFYCLRFFYDCLVHWTGAGPAEHSSYLKRPLFAEYQRKVRCFFPCELPFVNHHRQSGWPESSPNKAK